MTPGGPVGLHELPMPITIPNDRTSFVRSARGAVVDIGSHVCLVARNGVVRRIEGDGAQLARAVLSFASTPRTRVAIHAHVESLTGPFVGGRSGEQARVVDEVLELLVATGALVPAGPVEESRAAPARTANIVVAVTGAIAATHAPALVAALQRRGHTVEVALTAAAQRFVAVGALAAITRREIHTAMWPANAHAAPPHIALAEWADLVVVYPATATTLSRLAHGDFSELVSALALTTRAPVVLVPSMNGEMAAAPAVQRNLEQLREDGFVVVHPVPSEEVADAPAVRVPRAATAPAPGEVAATIDALLGSGALGAGAVPKRRGPASSSSDWDAEYRGTKPTWIREDCEPDLAAVLVQHIRAGSRLLDVGCGLGQVARFAAARGADVVATDLSAVALELAQTRSSVADGSSATLDSSGARDSSAAHDSSAAPSMRAASITWLRDDICASNLVGSFDVIVDRAVLHTLSAARVHAWAAAMRRMTASGSALVVVAHRDGISGVTSGWTAGKIVEALGPRAFEIAVELATELPGIANGAPIPSVIAVLRRK